MLHAHSRLHDLCGGLLLLYALTSALPVAASASGATGTSFFTTSRATYDAWGANGQYPVPEPTQAFPSGTTMDHVALYFSYQNATPKVSTYAAAIYTGAGTKVASGNPATLGAATGKAMTYINQSIPLADGIYEADLLLDGSVSNRFDFTVGLTIPSDPGQVPATIGAPNPVVAITGGYHHSLALLRDGTVYGWGDNASGQLGIGTLKNSSVPVRVKGLPSGDPVVGLSSTDTSSVALTRSGAVYTWGANDEGQLGLGSESATSVAVAPQKAFSLLNTFGLAPSGLALASGTFHTLMLAKDGHVYAWGDNGSGEIGSKMGDTLSNGNIAVPVPVAVPGLPWNDLVAGLAGGFDFSLVVTRSGKVYTWGDNQAAELGWGYADEKAQPHFQPAAVLQLPAGDPAMAVTGGNGISGAVTRSGAVYVWGTNDRGLLGNGTKPRFMVPVRVQGLPAGDPAASVSCGPNAAHSNCLALTRSGKVYGWGANDYGQLGIGTFDAQAHAIAAPVQGLPATDPVVSIDAVGRHSLAVTRSGLVYAWGDNTDGALGNGSTTNSALPVLVQLPHAGSLTPSSSAPNVTPAHTAGATGTPTIAIGNLGLAHEVNGQLQYTYSLHQGEQGTFYAPYTLKGTGSAQPTGTLTLMQNGKQIVSEPMQPGTFSDGVPNLNALVYFSPSHPAGQITATVTLRWGGATATKTYTFTLAPAV